MHALTQTHAQTEAAHMQRDLSESVALIFERHYYILYLKMMFQRETSPAKRFTTLLSFSCSCSCTRAPCNRFNSRFPESAWECMGWPAALAWEAGRRPGQRQSPTNANSAWRVSPATINSCSTYASTPARSPTSAPTVIVDLSSFPTSNSTRGYTLVSLSVYFNSYYYYFYTLQKTSLLTLCKMSVCLCEYIRVDLSYYKR